MKSKPSLRNLAKSALLLSLCLILSGVISGCTSSTVPSYVKEELKTAIPQICKNEYKIDVKVKLVDDTVWIYMPVEDMFINAEKPTKYTPKFAILANQTKLEHRILSSDYAVESIPEKSELQNTKLNPKIQEQINRVLKVLMRVLLSLDRAKQKEPKFFCLITADIKGMDFNGEKVGLELKQAFYYLDFKKFIYGLLSVTEFQHRAPQEFFRAPEIIGDKEGKHLEYKNITMPEFIESQIEHRIKLKFETPEVEKNTDIDKEVLKIITNTLKIYDFKNFSAIELDNLLTKNRMTLNRAAVWANTTEEK